MGIKIHLLDDPLLDYVGAFSNDLNYLLGCRRGHFRRSPLLSPFFLRSWFLHDDETQAPITQQLHLKA